MPKTRHRSSLFPLVSMRRLERTLRWRRSDLRRIAGRSGRYYRSFDIRPLTGGKWRHLDNPTGALKSIQRRLKKEILDTVPLPATMLGAVTGCSIVDNMTLHAGKACVGSVDLRDCFPRTGYRSVFRLYRELFGCSTEIAGLLTRLTTFQSRLPQGAPTSSTLANLSLLQLHDEFSEVAQEKGLAFSMWVDDIAFSGPTEAVREMVGLGIDVVRRHGHAVRCKKVSIMPRHKSQRLTGGVLNRKVSPGRRRIEEIRGRILVAAKSGSPLERELQSIRGSIQFVSHCNPSQGRSLRRFAERKLPDTGLPSMDKRKVETRPCRRAGRHANRPCSSRRST